MKIEKELNLNELLNLAIAIEQRGEKFYREQASISSKSDIKQIFNDLAKQEKEHCSFFLKILENDKSYDPENPMPDDYYEYLYQYATISLFKIKERKLEKGNIVDILSYAIDVELYSILYYYEFQKYLQPADYEILQNIILEEKSHYNKLVKLLNEYE